MSVQRQLPPILLSKLHRRIIYASVAALVVTGIAWLVCHYFLNTDAEMADMPHPLEPWWMKWHGAFAMIGLFAAGSLFPWHAWRAWQLRRNRTTGLAMTIAMLLLVVTGWALYYAGGEETRPVLSVAHWVIGIVAPLALVVHVVVGRRRRSAKPRGGALADAD